MMLHSVFAIEVCCRFEAGLHQALTALIAEHPERSGYKEKWQLYRRAAELVMGQLEHLEKGCWDYFDDNAKATRDYDMWVSGMTTKEGARNAPSGLSDPYRGIPRHLTLTMAFLVVQGSPTDISLSALCNVPERDLWRRGTFARILNGMGAISFASVKSDVLYVIPRDADWGLTADDLGDAKFDYLRPVTSEEPA